MTPSSTDCEMTQIILPGHTNNHGTAFGGQITAWVDICASVSARRFCRGPVVTASIDQVHFLRPVTLGMILVLKSRVNQAWNSSMEVGVRIEIEDEAAERHLCSTAYLTFVSLDENGKPRSLPALENKIDLIDKRRSEEADKRREVRLEMREWRMKKRAETR